MINKEKRNFNIKKLKKQVQGITLIALVVTIIVLLILAGIAINLTIGQNGIFSRAQDAANTWRNAETNEQLALEEGADLIDEYLNGNGGNQDDNPNADVTTVDTVQIPKGFYYVGGRKESGIVISDNPVDKEKYKGQDIVGTDLIGNQYVWISTDGILQEIEGDGGKTVEDAINGQVVLGRYIFNDNGQINSTDTPTTLGENISLYEYFTPRLYMEDLESLANFINSVRENKGYYIARYEASYGIDGKAKSKISNGYIENDGEEYAPEGEANEGYLWNNITKKNAKIACENLYEGKINSDLMNSYAWDTAILFIQKYSGNTTYSMETGESVTGQLNNTGINKLKSTNQEDVECNIYDMAGNAGEWTTEENNYGYPYISRGGKYDRDDLYVSYRFIQNDNNADSSTTFRSILYW